MRRANGEKIFWGVFLILGAVFLLASKMGFVEGIGTWSLIWTILFVAILIKSLVKLEYFGMFTSIAFLAIIYDEYLGITEITPWPVLIAAWLLSIGCGMIFPKKNRKWKEHIKDHVVINADCSERVVDEDDGETIQCGVRFGEKVKYINTDKFVRAEVSCQFGSLELYFDNAGMKGTTGYVNVTNSFGSIDIYVPRNWQVMDNISSSFGGVDYSGRPEPDGVHKLYIEGANSFGGVDIHYV